MLENLIVLIDMVASGQVRKKGTTNPDVFCRKKITVFRLVQPGILSLIKYRMFGLY